MSQDTECAGQRPSKTGKIAPQVLRTLRSPVVTGVGAAATANTTTPRDVLHKLPLDPLVQQRATLWRPPKNMLDAYTKPSIVAGSRAAVIPLSPHSRTTA
jgi:hypothetical protein